MRCGGVGVQLATLWRMDPEQAVVMVVTTRGHQGATAAAAAGSGPNRRSGFQLSTLLRLGGRMMRRWRGQPFNETEIQMT